MRDDDCTRSPELDETRELLFPSLAPSEGWARIEAALAAAADDERWARIEAAARREDLHAALRDALSSRN